MLNKREKRVMDCVYALCEKEGSCLCSPWDIQRQFPAGVRPDESQLEDILRALQTDGYFDVILSSRKGERVYVITLRPVGCAYRRENLQQRRNIALKISLAAVCAALSFLVGLLLRSLVS